MIVRMAQEIQPRPMTLDDYYRLPEDDGLRHELQAGFLVAEPQPGARHAILAARLGEWLSAHVQKDGLGFAFAEGGFLLATDPITLRAPDVSFVTGDRVAHATDLIRAFPGAPDFAIEVLSPSNTREAIRTKVAEYLAAGTRLAWVVDPHRRVVTAYTHLLEPEAHRVGEQIDAGDVVPGFTLTLADLFSGPGFDDAP